jgi:hypothetical protein
MGMSEFRSVQFRGKEDVLAAFLSVRAMNWAIFNGKVMLERYEGDDPNESEEFFKQYIHTLCRSRTNSTYRLQTYDELPKGAKIKPSTEPDRSFNFVLFDEYNRPEEVTSGYQKLMDRIDALSTQVQLLQEKEEPEETISGLGSTLGKILEVPAVQQKIAQVFESLIEKIIPSKPVQMPLQVIEPYQEPSPGVLNGVPSGGEDDELQKLNQAIEILYRIDPKLGTHLLKLAGIAQANPSKYQNMISMLNLA